MDGANHGTTAPAAVTGEPSAEPPGGADRSTPRQVRRRKFLQSLRKFWIAGAAGAYFSALSHNLPTDLMALRSPSRPPFALGHFFLQYGYMRIIGKRRYRARQGGAPAIHTAQLRSA